MNKDKDKDKDKINSQQVEGEINLRDLIIALWRQKLIIISITLIASIFTGLYSVFMLSPVFHSKLNIVINMPEIYHTKYGDYTLPLTTNQQYINLITSNNIIVNTMKDMGYDADGMTIEDLKESISIGAVTTVAGVEQNCFEVKVAAGNPEEVKKLAQALYDNYIEFLDVMTAEGAVAYYTNDYTVKLRSLEVELESNHELLKMNEELLAETPQTINQGDALKEIQGDAKTSDFVILENIINSNYTKIESDIILNKQTINEIENSISLYNSYLDDLGKEQNDIKAYYESGKFEQIKSNIVSITNTNVYLPSPPAAPSQKTSPSNTKNVIIGAILGGIIGVFIAFINEYWLKKV
jgi:capsular polysaccharide biosynthesis protein